jgi:cyclase
MRKNIFLPAVIFSLLVTLNLHSQDSTKAPPTKITKFNDNLFEITLAPVNTIASIGKDGVLIVEANYVEYSRYLREELKKLGNDKIKYIIDTHWHFDHCGGNKVFGKEATIIAHSEVKKFLSRDEILLGDTQNAYPDYALPKITFETEYDLCFNGDSIKVIAVSGGHSAGDAIVYFKNSNVVHIGDIIFSDMFPFIDVDHGGSVVTLADNIQRIIDIMPPDVKIIPGHGRDYTIEELKEYRNMVVKTKGIVQKELLNGKSLDEIKKANVLKNWKDWEGSFSCNDWIEFIYYSLKKL